MSWISLSDEIGAIRFLLDRKDISGPVNLTAPAPVTNAEFTAALTAAVGRRDLPWLRVPAPPLRLALGEASVELLGSARVMSRRLPRRATSSAPHAARGPGRRAGQLAVPRTTHAAVERLGGGFLIARCDFRLPAQKIPNPGDFMITGTLSQIAAKTARDHEALRPAGKRQLCSGN